MPEILLKNLLSAMRSFLNMEFFENSSFKFFYSETFALNLRNLKMKFLEDKNF